jgi:hypothetical protein
MSLLCCKVFNEAFKALKAKCVGAQQYIVKITMSGLRSQPLRKTAYRASDKIIYMKKCEL